MPIEKVNKRINFDQVEQVKKVFAKYDSDKSGAIDAKELKRALAGLGISTVDDESLATLHQEMDADNSGKIEFSEFLDWYPTLVKLQSESTVSQAEENDSGVNWDTLKEKLPFEKTAEEKKARRSLFRQFDPNGNGYLSLAEVDKGMRDVVQLHLVFNCKPVIMRAFQAAKGVGNARSRPGSYGPDFVEFREFRMLLWYVRQYFELWQMFDLVDSTDDRRIEIDEFEGMLGMLNEWGLEVDKSAADLFAEIDLNGGGIILFNEFAAWALRKGLDLVDDDDEDVTGHTVADIKVGTQYKVRKVHPAAVPAGINWDTIKAKLPYEKTAEDKATRKDIWGRFDPNGNGYLSLAETDKGMRDVVQLYLIFDCKPVIMRAFQAAKSINDARNKPGSHGPDYIEWCEFRMLLWYVRQYFELWQMFDLVDSTDDRRIEIGEFEGMVDKLQEWGLKGNKSAADLFAEIDVNGGGKILFDEFASWALKKGLDLVEDDE